MIVRRILAGAVAVLLVITVALSYYTTHALRESMAAKAALVEAVEAAGVLKEQRKADARTLLARQQENAAQARKLREAQQGLQTALDANSGWASTLVPPAVRSAILSDSEKEKMDAE